MALIEAVITYDCFGTFGVTRNRPQIDRPEILNELENSLLLLQNSLQH